MKAIELVNAEIGTVSSRQDGSVAFRVISAELRPSEAGLVLQFHGKACRVTIYPHEGAPDSVVSVATERDVKSPTKRLYDVIFIHFDQAGRPGDFETFRRIQMDKIIEGYKTKNLKP